MKFTLIKTKRPRRDPWPFCPVDTMILAVAAAVVLAFALAQILNW